MCPEDQTKSRARRRRGRRKERGIALALVLFAATLLLLLLLTTLTITATSGRFVARQLAYQGQAENAASAGLTNSLSWYVHQKQQPVTTFAPVLDPNGVCPHTPPHVPPVNETEDPTIGLMRTYEVMGQARVFARYEVRKSEVTDVSQRRGKPQPGTIWQLTSHGIIYIQNDATKGPGLGGNTIITQATLRNEIQRMSLLLPANAALSGTDSGKMNIAKAGRVIGGSTGIGVAYGTGASPKFQGTVTGNPALSSTSGAFALNKVFGAEAPELSAMADLVVDDEKDLPDPLPPMSLVIVKGNATFNPTKRLNGSGILIVMGNLILNPQSNAFYDGVIWVGGDLVMSPPAQVSGAVVVNGNVQLTGGSDVSEIDYDSGILDQVKLQMGNYHFSRTPWVP
jgi:hypothetical protein